MNDRAKRLIKSHQKLFPKGVGIECGNGWLELIDLVCHYFENKLRDKSVDAIQFAQIKEKFGLLRIYFDVQFPSVNKDDNRMFHELHSFIATMEGVSSIVCEECGRMKNEKFKVNVVMRTIHGWRLTLCDTCFTKRQKRTK